MFELPMAYVHQAERERDVAADLRRRQILKTTADTSGSDRTATTPLSGPRTAGTRVRALER